ncbi:MAG: ribbon-helix-helix protein, CopG family [bacterium]|nr:ribbon-helix-helix protein, CopG family [bacterium]
MPRVASKREKTRLNLEVTRSVRERLNRLLDLCEAESLTEVIRRALATYEALLEQQASGSEIVIRPKDGGGKERVLLVS